MIAKFAERIKKLRKSAGLSQKEAAAKLQVSQAQLSHYENGIRECGLDFVVKLSSLYGVSCDYILGAVSNKAVASNIHSEALALDALLSAADKMEDKSSANAITKAADCCIYALADAALGENSSLDKKTAHCSLGAAEVFIAAVDEDVSVYDQNLVKTLKNAEADIKAIIK